MNKELLPYTVSPDCDDNPIWNVFLSANHYPSLIAAVELGLFENLEKNPSTRVDLAQALNLMQRPTDILLGLMVSLGFVVQHAGLFHNTSIARTYLLKGSAYFWGGMLHHDRDLAITGNSVLSSLKADRPSTPHKKDLWQNGPDHPTQIIDFTAAMHSHSNAAACRMAHMIDFSASKRLLDVGGGSGCFAAAIASRYPELNVAVAELPEVCEITKRYLLNFPLSDRVETIGFNMFSDAWPIGFDSILMSNILHDWSDEECLFLLVKAYNSLPENGRIYLHEMLLNDDGTGPLAATSFSMTMMRLTHGRQRSATEINALLHSAGFVNPVVVGATGYHSICLALKQ